MRNLALCVALAGAAGWFASGGDEELKANPGIRLEKPRYVLGESIRFWVIVNCERDARIPEKYWNTCLLHIRKPDGTERTDKIWWPMDGQLDRGWMGGHTLKPEDVQAGTFTFVFEFAGRKTQPVELVVSKLDVDTRVSNLLFSITGSRSREGRKDK